MASSMTAGGSGAARGNKLFYLILLLLAVFLGASVASFVYLNTVQEHDAEYLRLTAEQRIQTELISKHAFEAVNLMEGRGPFLELQESQLDFEFALELLLEGDEFEGIPPAPRVARIQVENVAIAWQEINDQVALILDSEMFVPTARRYGEQLNEVMPEMQSEFEALVTALESAGAPQNQVRAAMRQQLASQRVLDRINALLNLGPGAEEAAEVLEAEIEQLGENLRALQDGGQGIPRVTGSTARGHLETILRDFGMLEDLGGYIAMNADGLLEVTRVSRQIIDDIAGLQDSLTLQEQAFQLIIDERPIEAYHAAIFGLIGLIMMITAIYMLASQIRQLLRNAREESQRNQDAILQLLDEMGNLAEGDLSVQATVTEDITGAIADSINYAIEALRDLVTTINNTAERVTTAAVETRDTASRLIDASEKQTTQIHSATQSIDRMVRSIEEVSENAQRSSTVAQQSVEIATKGGQAVRRTIEGMDTIREQIQETSKRIKRLGESSQEIGNIVELINDIAEQTNILALNAAIQASSAGEAGRGFAVVADEVQRLAERSTNATKQIESLVRTIQADTNEAVASMEKSTAGVVSGAQLAEDAGNSLDEIERVSNQIAGLVQTISDAAGNQAEQASEVSRTMSAIEDITVQTAEGTRATGEAIGRLADMATELRSSVAGFKLP